MGFALKRLLIALALAFLASCSTVPPPMAPPPPPMAPPPPPPPPVMSAPSAADDAAARMAYQQALAQAERSASQRQAQTQVQAERAAAEAAQRRVQAASNTPENTTQVKAQPVATVPEAGQSTSTAIVDQVLSQLTLGDVAFNSPTVINIEETVSVRVALSPDQGRAAVTDRITEPGTVMAESLQVSNMMEARLTGEGFKIVAVTAERQAVSSGITEWIWDITPVTEGKQQLTLTMDALITVNGALVPKTLRTFRKPIEVEVTAVQRAGVLLGEHGKWAWSTLLLPLWAWLSRRKKANKASVTESK